MLSSTTAADRQPQATAGNRSQSEMAILAKVATMHLLDACVIAQASFNGCLVSAAQHSGKEDQEIADEIHICHGYMSRFMRGVGQQWAKRLIAFMRTTQSLAPLQWMAEQMGCDLVVRHRVAAEAAQLRARLAELERGSWAA